MPRGSGDCGPFGMSFLFHLFPWLRTTGLGLGVLSQVPPLCSFFISDLLRLLSLKWQEHGMNVSQHPQVKINSGERWLVVLDQ